MPSWGWALAGGAVAAAAIALWLRRSVFHPLAEVSKAAEALARGGHEARVHVAPGPLAGLGAVLNLLAERFQHDITELRRLEQVRREFVANVSHELRTPLASIAAYAETLSQGALEDKENRAGFVAEIEKNAARMARLVDDLLTLSAIEAGKMPPAFEPVDLMRIAGEVVAGLMPLAQRKRIVIRLEPFRDIPQVRADRNQLKQVFTNLIDNAVKYTAEDGTIRVTASSGDGKVTVEVHDNGSGILAQDLPRIFERFYRVDKARSRELGGTGLGLAIVKHIVEVHGGTVAVQSVPGQGSTFCFTLPTLG